MKTFNHGQARRAESSNRDRRRGHVTSSTQVLVHSYEKQGEFKNHFDQNSQAVALWSVGHSAVFTCCFSDQCERHGSVDRPSCPHCHEFKFESAASVESNEFRPIGEQMF